MHAQLKLSKGISPTANDFQGFKLTQEPPTSHALNTSIKREILAAMATLSQQPMLEEQQWIACQRPSSSSVSMQLLHDSRHLLNQAGDDLLLVGIVVNPKQTSAGLQSSIFKKLLRSASRTVSKILRQPSYLLQHATYTAVVPDYGKIALVVRELAQIYANNSSLFKSIDVFYQATEAMLDVLEAQFFSTTGLPPAVCECAAFCS